MVLGISSGILETGNDHPKIRDLDSFISGFAWVRIPEEIIFHTLSAVRRWLYSRLSDNTGPKFLSNSSVSHSH
jgi:hypothetical protein